MTTREGHTSKPARAAERRAAGAERRAETARTGIQQERDANRRLTAALADMTEDRDRWRAQAERLGSALDKLRVPAAPASPIIVPAQPCRSEPDADLLYGVPAIAAHMNLKPAQVYHLHRKGALPLFKVRGKTCWSRTGHVQWLAEQEAAARKAPPASGGEGR